MLFIHRIITVKTAQDYRLEIDTLIANILVSISFIKAMIFSVNNVSGGGLPRCYRCDCLSGFHGPRCNEDVRLCASNPCQGDATCVNNTSNDFTCLCSPRFTGECVFTVHRRSSRKTSVYIAHFRQSLQPAAYTLREKKSFY